MAKARRQRGTKRPANSPPAKAPPAADPTPPAADPAPPAADPAPPTEDNAADDSVDPAERPSRRGTLVAAAVVIACAAATGLLLSGWTPGPGSPSGAAATTAPATRPAPAKTTPRKARVVKKARVVRKPPLTRKQVQQAALVRARNVSRDLFSNECGVCHTLAAAGTSGLAGPNLDKLRPTGARVLLAIRSGGRGSGLMSPNLVVGNDAFRIARFVAQATHH
jgi:hypothetical protein